MAAALNGLLRTGLALKLNQVKRATRAYLRDRTNQATDTVTSYAVAAGLFAAAGIFLLAACLVGLTAGRLKRPPPQFPSLTSRLRVAIKSNPAQPDQIEAARDTAAAVLLAPSAPARARRGRLKAELRPRRDTRNTRAGLILVATLLGWAAVRRRQQARGTVV
jgi:hypothetical protein